MACQFAPAYGDHTTRIGSVSHGVGVAVTRERFSAGSARKVQLCASVMQVNADAAAMIKISPSRGEQRLDDVGRDGALGTSTLRMAGEMKGWGGMGAYRRAQG